MSITKTNIVIIYIIALILITRVDNIISKKIISGLENKKENWGRNSNCYGYSVINSSSKIDKLKDFYVGKNLDKGFHVYLYTSKDVPYNHCATGTVVTNGFKIYSIERYLDSNFYGNNPNFRGYMCWTYKKCKEVRNQGDLVPKNKIEIIDSNIKHKNYKLCNYICRTVYQEEFGLCTYYLQKDNTYQCTYLADK